MYILDTNVVSELRKSRDKANRNVIVWFDTVDATTIYLSAITLLELEIGVLRMARRDAQQAALLRRWMNEQVIPRFEKRTLSIDASVAMRCAQLHVPNPRADRDAWIAATALVHGMTVVTRNVADFTPTGVTVLNPWDAVSS